MLFATLLGLFDLIEGAGGLLNFVWAIICWPVYAVIRTNFNVFVKIAEIDLAANVNITEIYKRATMIMTIVMTFYVTFNIVKYTISPDTIADKEKGVGKVVYRIIGAILLIAFVPTLFSMAYKIQNRLIKTQVFSKIILGEENWDYQTYGSSFAADTFSAFYRVDEQHCAESTMGCEKAREQVAKVIEGIRRDGSTAYVLDSMITNFSVNAIDFDGLLALVFGCYVVYVIFLYSIDVAIRCIQLLYLQIIAPIAIMTFIIPNKDNTFQKWVKQCLTTYLDLFIRISILYFAMLIIKILGHSWDILLITSDGKHIGPIAYIFFITGILIFIQRAPKLLEELFPKAGAASIGFGTQWKTRGEPLKKSFDSLKRPISSIVGGTSSVISTIKSLKAGNLKKALLGKFTDNPLDENGNPLPEGDARNKILRKNKRRRAFHSAYIAGKSLLGGGIEGGKKNRIFGAYADREKQGQAAENVLNDGGTPFGHDIRGMHYQGVLDDFQHFIDKLNGVVDGRKTMKESREELKTLKALRSYLAEWQANGVGDAAKRGEFGKAMEKIVDAYTITHNKTEAENRIVAALLDSGIVGRDEDSSEFQAVVSGLLSNLEKDGASQEGHIHRTNITEYRKAAMGAEGALDETGQVFTYGEFTDVPKRNADGSIVTQLVEEENEAGETVTVRKVVFKKLSELTDEEFVRFAAGDIESTSSDRIRQVQTSAEFKEAKANAHVPGTKDEKKS